MLASGEYLGNQVVWTYLPDRWPAGLISGHGDAEGRFWVRHVTTYRRGLLLPMLRAGIEEAEARGYRQLVVVIPTDFPAAVPLLRVARRMGFEPYETTPSHYAWVKAL